MIERENKQQEPIQQGMEYTACCTLADLTNEPTNEAQKIKNAKRGDINFYLCDCIEFMKTKPDKYYDLAIVDPPYGIGAAKEKPHNGWKDWGIKEWDNESPNAEYFEQLFRVSKNQIIWGANHFISKMPFDSSCWLIWDKGQRDFSLADGEMAWTSFKKAMRIYTISRAKALQEGKRHPTQKPIQLYRWILTKFAEKGMKILDTHGGSFTNAFACDIEGFALDICEIDEEYFNNGLKAFDEYKRQTKLF